MIGLDSDIIYQMPLIYPVVQTKLYRIGGSGNIRLAPDDGPKDPYFRGPTQSYTPGQGWKTFTLDATKFGTGPKGYLVLICADDYANDGVSEAAFRNVRIYNSASQQASDVPPLIFDFDTGLPRFLDSNGKDLGVVSVDLDGDGLPDLSDWRATDFTTSGSVLSPLTVGNIYRNTGSGFMLDNALLPPVALPLSVRSANDTAYTYVKKHHFLAQPMDVDGDGQMDLLASVDIQKSSSVVSNRYAFYHRAGSGWIEKTGWGLPFRITNIASSESNGERRDHHFQWADLNSDGYQDLLVYTTAYGRLKDISTGLEIAGGDASIAYLNKGKLGPGWVRDDSYALPERLSKTYPSPKDEGRRLMDLEGDGIADIAEATMDSGSVTRHTYKMSAAGTYRWNSTINQENPPASVYDLPTPLVSSDGNDKGVSIFDCNGDGNPDILQHVKTDGSPDQATWLNRGYRAIPASSWVAEPAVGGSSYMLPLPLHYTKDGQRVQYGYEMADINGDGLVDILYANLEMTYTPGPDNLAILNTGNGWMQRVAWQIPAGGGLICESNTDLQEGRRRAKLQDLNGDGFPDLITNILGGTPKVWYNQCRPEVLTSVTDGFSSQLQVEYRRLNDPAPTDGFGTRVYQKWTDSMPAGQNAVIDARLVVSSYSEPDGNGGRRVRSQRYGDLRYDRYNESSLGFGWIEAKDHLNNQTTRTETSRVYPFGGSPLWTRTWVEVKPGDLLPALVGVTAGTKCLSEETAAYAEMTPQAGLAGGTIRRPVQTGSVKTLYDLKETMVSRTTTVQNLADFDAYGFVKNSTVTALDGSVVATANNYTHTVDASRWHLGRLSQSVVSKTNGGKPSITKTSSFTYVSTNGLLETETIEPGNSLGVTKTYTHDGFGNVTGTAVTGSGITRSGSTIYDSMGRFVLAESNQLGHTVSCNYDAQRALLLSTTDINGKTTAFGYDSFGTLTRTYHPDGTQTGESTGFASNAQLPAAVAAEVFNPILYFRAKQSSGSPVAKVYLDALGREIVAETTVLRNAAASGTARYSKVYTVTCYDALGRKIRVSEAFGPGDDPNFTAIGYDLLGRVVITTHPDGQSDVAQEFNTASISGQPTTYSRVSNVKSGVLERWEDQHGRFIQSRDPSGQTTIFNHDHEGRLISVAVGDDILLTNTFDIFGNKTSVIEANSGTSSSVYNAFGEITSSTNANGQATSFTYDALGRPTILKHESYEINGIIIPEKTYTTTYDGARGSGLGKPWETIGPDGYQEIVSYDSFGRPRNTTKTQFGETFRTSTSYDALGRVFTSTDAGGLTVVNEYDPTFSFPIAMRIGPGVEGAGTLLWQAGTFDSRGRVLTQTLAQGVSTSASYKPATGLLASLNSNQDSTYLQSKTYEWDTMGNLTSRNDAIAARGETFTYDTLNRVTGSSVATLPGSTITTVPPPATYTYDIKGNLLSKPGLSNVAYGGSRPHAVTAATVKGVSRSYTYDAAGYVTADGKRSYTWTSFGQLSSLDYLSAPALQTFAGITVYQASRVLSDFDFDAGGNRARQIKQRIAAGDSRQVEDTLYLGSYEREIHMTKATASASPVVTKTVHRHSIGGFAVYTRTDKPGLPSETKLSTILKDHLGSTDVILTGQWNGSTFANFETERQSFDPWGERRSPVNLVAYRATDADAFRTSAQDYDRGFTGHEQLDDSGLIHMNGRIYDPELGRMLSPDPVVQVPEFSQNFNRYSYVMNNPLNLTDPTGFSWLGNVFHRLGHWLSQNWRTVVSIVVAVIAWYAAPSILGFFGAPASITATGASATLGGLAAQGAVAGGIAGGFNAGINGGNLGDVLRGAAVGAIQGAIAGGILHAMKPNGTGFSLQMAEHVAGHGVLGGACNAAMGGKFQDGFLSAAISAGANDMGLVSGGVIERTVKSGIIGGTASALGGGKFANGAYTAAFQHLLNEEIGKNLYDKISDGDDIDGTKATVGDPFAQALNAAAPEARAAAVETAGIMVCFIPIGRLAEGCFAIAGRAIGGVGRIFGLGAKAAPILEQGAVAVLKNGYYEVNGLKFSKIYYEKLWSTGRGAPSLVANEILASGANGVPDVVKAGFLRYESAGWEMVFNPATKEVWHLQPLK